MASSRVRGWGMLLAGLLLAGATARADVAVLSVSSLMMQPEIAPAAVAVLEDPAGTMTLKDVLQADAGGRFRRLRDEPLAPGISRSAWWQRFTLANDTDTSQALYLVVAEPTLDDARLFQLKNGAVHVFLPQGRMAPSVHRVIDVQQPVFALTLAPGDEATYYLRTWSQSSMVVPLRVDTPLSLAGWRQGELLLLVLYGAVVATLFIYNLFLFFTIRDQSYLAYCVSIMSIFLCVLTVDGWHYLPLGDNVWLKHRAFPFAVYAAASSTLWFAMVFLETRERLPWLHRVMQGLLVLYAAFALLTCFFYGRELVIAVDTLIMLAIPTVVLAGALVALQGHRPAFYYNVAWGATMVGATVTIMANHGLLPPLAAFLNAIKFGQVAEVVLMSFALAYRIRAVNIERDSALKHASVAQARAEAKSQFLAHMSHEIRTPMNGIVGMVELLRDSELSRQQQDMLRTIQESADSLVTVIDDVLDTAKLEAGRVELRPQPVALRPLMASVIDTFRGVATQRRLELSSRCEDGLPTAVSIDPVRLRQMLLNLVSNAVKFTDHGSVTLLAQSSSDGRRLLLRVRDTGIGIPAGQQQAVFDSFHQVGGRGARGRGGTGLGLTIARDLARLMGGDITLESRIGEGSTFTVSLPLQPVQLPGEARDGVPENHWRGRRALVCEDNPVNQLVLRGLLERRGLEVDMVATGEEAMRYACARDYDVLFMDRNLPGLDGMEATRRVREEEARRRRGRVPIVAVTADALPEHRAECLAAGMDAHLPKPVRAGDLDDLLMRLFGDGLSPSAG